MRKSLLLLAILYSARLTGQEQQVTPAADTADLHRFECRLPERMPEYPGGTFALQIFIKKNFILPDSLQDLEGRLVLSFDITERGRPENIQVKRSLHPVADSLAAKLIGSMPDWRPGISMGKTARTNYILPVRVSPQ